MEDVQEEEGDDVVDPEHSRGGESGYHEDEAVKDPEDVPEGDVGGVLGEEHQVPAVAADAGHPVVGADAPEEAAHLPGQPLVVELGDGDPRQGDQPTTRPRAKRLAVVEGVEEANLAQDGVSKGAIGNLEDGEEDDPSDTERAQDRPVELVEEEQLRLPSDNKAAVGEQDEEDSEEEVEEDDMAVDANANELEELVEVAPEGAGLGLLLLCHHKEHAQTHRTQHACAVASVQVN